MEVRKILGMTAWSLLASVSIGLGADKIFTTSGEIRDGDNWDNVYVYGNDTLVEMSGGTVNAYLTAYDSSTVNVTGGFIGQDLVAHNTSALYVRGGTVGYDINIHESGVVKVYAGATITDDIYIYDSGTLFMYGGGVGDNLQAYGSTIVDIQGGDITDNLGAHGSCVMNLRGGETDYVLWADESSTISIYGYNLNLNTFGGAFGHGEVTGLWADYTPFQIDLDTSGTHTHIDLIEIPEPATLSLLAFGVIVLIRRGRKR